MYLDLSSTKHFLSNTQWNPKTLLSWGNLDADVDRVGCVQTCIG